MRVLGSTVLALEAIVVMLAIPIAINNSDVNAGLALSVGLGIALLMLLTIGVITKPYAVAVGWVLQVIAIGLGFVVPTMFVIGGVFALLWFFAVRNGQRIDRAKDDHSRDLGEQSP